jgi:hypothetical protein
MDEEYVSISNQIIVAYFKLLYPRLKRLKKTTKNLGKNNR